MKVKNTEQRTLTVGIIINLLMSITGLAIFSVTHLQALFLDASFVLIEVISGIIAITISKVSQNKIRGFPKGLFNLEPIYIFLKSILVITLMGLTTWNVSLRAYHYFATGEGTRISAVPVLAYSVAMVILGFCLLKVYRHGNANTNGTSELLSVESKNSFIDVALSAGIGVVAIGLMFISARSPLSFLLYTGDFFITVTLVILFINQPIGYMKQAIREILDGTISSNVIQHQIKKIVTDNIPDGWKFNNILAFKKGMHLQVDIYCVPKESFSVFGLYKSIRTIKERLISIFKLVDVNFVIDDQSRSIDIGK